MAVLLEDCNDEYSLSCVEILKNSYKLSLSKLGAAEIKEKYIKIKSLQKLADKYK